MLRWHNLRKGEPWSVQQNGGFEKSLIRLDFFHPLKAFAWHQLTRAAIAVLGESQHKILCEVTSAAETRK